MLKIFLVIGLFLSDGTSTTTRVPTVSWDDCYAKGLEETYKAQQNPEVTSLYLSCELQEIK